MISCIFEKLIAQAKMSSPSENMDGRDFIGPKGRRKLDNSSRTDKQAQSRYAQRRNARVQQLREHFEKVAGKDGQISQEEFKSSIKSKNNFFTERLFKMFDRTDSGHISVHEFHRLSHEDPDTR